MKIKQYNSLSKQDKLTARLSDLYFWHYNATRKECTIRAREEREALQLKNRIWKTI